MVGKGDTFSEMEILVWLDDRGSLGFGRRGGIGYVGLAYCGRGHA